MASENDYFARSVNGFIREAPNSLIRSFYAVEINPWTTRGDVEAANFFRGTIVSAFAYIDTRLSELAIRTSYMPEYQGLRQRFPYRFDKRINYLKEVFAHPPLSKFEKLASQFLCRLENEQDLRNLAAHAKMQVMPESGVTFYDFPRSDSGGVHFRRIHRTLGQLDESALKMARLSRLCQVLLEELEQACEIPPLE